MSQPVPFSKKMDTVTTHTFNEETRSFELSRADLEKQREGEYERNQVWPAVDVDGEEH